MATKDDVIMAAENYAIASYKEGLYEDDAEELSNAIKESKDAAQKFREILDEFEQTLLNKEEKPCK